MSKRVLSLLAIIAITAMMGTSMISVDAAGKPIKSDPVPFGFPISEVLCGMDVIGTVSGTITTTTWEDQNRVKTVAKYTGELFSNDELVASFNGEQSQDRHDDGHVTIQKVKHIVHCANGGTDNTVTVDVFQH